MSADLAKLITEKRVIVCCGSGGVGKTTTSAALAMLAARSGKRAAVITIDPARRLATSLGLKQLSPKVEDLTEHVSLASDEPLSGRFHAVMPDTNQTFENWVKSMAGENRGLAARVLKTSIYKIFAKEFSGTNEYMAMEKLYELYQSRQYDLIVLDTPPSANTRTFLEAPRLLAEFFDDKVIKWFVTPGSRLLAGGIKKILEVLERLTGRGFISDLIEFTSALFELRAQFMENLKAVAELLHRHDVAFVVVTSPERLSKNDTLQFAELIRERGYHFWGFVVNRVLARKLGLAPNQDTVPAPPASITAEDETILRRNFELLAPQLAHETDAFGFLKSLSGNDLSVALVSEQPTDVHSVPALVALSKELATQ